MSITDELRAWIDGLYTPNSGTLKMEGERIADRIDEEHERAVADDELAAAPTEAQLEELGYIALPLDADGEYIRIGDVLYGYGKTIEVVELRYGRSGWVLISRDCNGYADTFAFTHYHAPTVEDVLREFAEKIIDSQIPNVHPTYEEAIAEYAKRLRLAEGMDA